MACADGDPCIICDGEEEDPWEALRPPPCKLCGYRLGGSHYHCAKCGRESSYQGCYGSQDGGKTWGFSCKPEDVIAWTAKMEELNGQEDS